MGASGTVTPGTVTSPAVAGEGVTDGEGSDAADREEGRPAEPDGPSPAPPRRYSHMTVSSATRRYRMLPDPRLRMLSKLPFRADTFTRPDWAVLP